MEQALQRTILSFGHETLEQKGFRLGDEIGLHPAQGRKKLLPVHFKKFIFKLQNQFHCEEEGQNIVLPALGGEEAEFCLELCPTYRSRQDKDCRFLFRSLTPTPFRLNGILSFEAFVERGDRIDLSYNRLIFQEAQSKEEVLDPSKAILTNEALMKSSLNILIEGETGTGKTRLASLIHERSQRGGPFVHLNLSSLAPGLIESELFGHIKGAFTGALAQKRGAFVLADQGTLFLDEIDSLPWEIQTKLLLYLDDKKIKPVGSEIPIETNVRLIFASGRKLKSLVQEGKMRKDFYFRLSSGHSFYLPSLRDKKELIAFHCKQFEKKEGVSLSPKLLAYYKELSWAGNIRQLLGHLQKKKVLSKNSHLVFDQTDQELKEEEGFSLKEDEQVISLEAYKKRYAQRVYNMNERHLKKTAKILEISPSTLREMLKGDQSATIELK